MLRVAFVFVAGHTCCLGNKWKSYSQKGEAAMYKVNGLMRKQALGLKCDQCDFEAINNNCLMMPTD